MKNSLFLMAFIFCLSTVFASSDTTKVQTSTFPSKGALKNPKLRKKNNCFKLCNPYKINTFCRLIQVGNYKSVNSMIEKGTDINNVSIKLTPLMYAARHNRADIVELLIDNGADLHAKSSRKGYTALKWAKLAKANEAYAIISAALKSQKK